MMETQIRAQSFFNTRTPKAVDWEDRDSPW